MPLTINPTPTLPSPPLPTPPPVPLPCPQDRDTALRKAGAGTPKCHIFSTFFLAKLLQTEAENDKRWQYDYSGVGGILGRALIWRYKDVSHQQ